MKRWTEKQSAVYVNDLAIYRSFRIDVPDAAELATLTQQERRRVFIQALERRKRIASELAREAAPIGLSKWQRRYEDNLLIRESIKRLRILLPDLRLEIRRRKIFRECKDEHNWYMARMLWEIHREPHWVKAIDSGMWRHLRYAGKLYQGRQEWREYHKRVMRPIILQAIECAIVATNRRAAEKADTSPSEHRDLPTEPVSECTDPVPAETSNEYIPMFDQLCTYVYILFVSLLLVVPMLVHPKPRPPLEQLLRPPDVQAMANRTSMIKDVERARHHPLPRPPVEQLVRPPSTGNKYSRVNTMHHSLQEITCAQKHVEQTRLYRPKYKMFTSTPIYQRVLRHTMSAMLQ
jgi:hypothetical protein